MAHALLSTVDHADPTRKGGVAMKKLIVAIAIVLGLNLINSMLSAMAPIYAQEDPAPQPTQPTPEPKPEKPDRD
jgi:hypothetical protein